MSTHVMPEDPNESDEKPSLKKFKKAAIADILVKGEDVVLQAEVHWAIFWYSGAVFIFALLVGTFIVQQLGYLLMATAAAMALHAWLKKEILMLVLTNKRVLVRYGILQVDVVDMRFSKIESVELERMLPGYLLGYANVVIMGTGNRYIVIPFVKNAIGFRRAYNKLTLADDKDSDDA